MSSKTYTIYVLALEEGKYYVGKTRDLNNRILAHRNKVASAWTTKYPYVKVLTTYTGDGFEEDKFVIKYMEEFGIENVRGGSYSNIDLTLDQAISIRRALATASNSCIACGYDDHYIQDCKTPMCYRCGRPNHLATACQAKSHALCGRLDGCYRCGRTDHWAIRCNRSKDIFGRPIESSCVVM